MNLTEEQIQDFFERIDKLDTGLRPKFGKMDVNQMVSHCADFFRMAKGTKKAEEYGVVDPTEIIALARTGKTAPTPKGFGQSEGDGTLPTDLESDKNILKAHIVEFSEFNSDFEFAVHPYFGKLKRERWVALAIYHLNHHLNQFGV